MSRTGKSIEIENRLGWLGAGREDSGENGEWLLMGMKFLCRVMKYSNAY